MAALEAQIRGTDHGRQQEKSSYQGSRPLGAGRPGDAGRRPVEPALHPAGEMGNRRRRRKRLMKRILTAAFCLILTGESPLA
ncbi:MAG: hypothetical protein ACLVG5_07710 [Clostridium sp.]